MKKTSLIILALVLMVGLSGCAANSAPVPSPTVGMYQNTPMPGETAMDGLPHPTEYAQTTAAMTGTESTALSKKANDAATKISEIDSCVTAIIGDTCVAGVQFDKQYKGEMTDRIRDMVTARIQSAAPNIDRIAITADPQIAAEIGTIANRISQTNALGELTGDLNVILEKIQ